jgi:hypothetical protein
LFLGVLVCDDVHEQLVGTVHQHDADCKVEQQEAKFFLNSLLLASILPKGDKCHNKEDSECEDDNSGKTVDEAHIVSLFVMLR